MVDQPIVTFVVQVWRDAETLADVFDRVSPDKDLDISLPIKGPHDDYVMELTTTIQDRVLMQEEIVFLETIGTAVRSQARSIRVRAQRASITLRFSTRQPVKLA